MILCNVSQRTTEELRRTLSLILRYRSVIAATARVNITNELAARGYVAEKIEAGEDMLIQLRTV